MLVGVILDLLSITHLEVYVRLNFLLPTNVMIINALRRWFCQNTSITIAKTSSLSQRSIRKDLSVLEAGANETGGLIVQVAQAAASPRPHHISYQSD